MFLRLAPVRGYSPDFLTPAVDDAGLAAAVDTLLTTPRRRLCRDLTRLARDRPLPAWGRSLADGTADALRHLGESVMAYHGVAVAPHWTRIRAVVEADRMARARFLLDHGTEGLLAGLHPAVRWNPPVMSVRYPVDRDIRLTGDGIRLVPSFFCWRTPITLRDLDDRGRPSLVYPIPHDAGRLWEPAGSRPEGALAALIGRTRARLLAMAADAGCTTGRCADRLGISPPACSQHITTLREAGLLVSRRHGQHVLHTLTPLGADLVDRG